MTWPLPPRVDLLAYTIGYLLITDCRGDYFWTANWSSWARMYLLYAGRHRWASSAASKYRYY